MKQVIKYTKVDENTVTKETFTEVFEQKLRSAQIQY